MYYEEKTKTFSVWFKSLVMRETRTSLAVGGQTTNSTQRWKNRCTIKVRKISIYLIYLYYLQQVCKGEASCWHVLKLLKYTRSRSENVLLFSLSHLDFRISNGFSNLPEIRVQRWKHRVLAGMRRLQVGLGGGASLPSWADLSEVHPARSLQRGQLVTFVGSRWRASEDKPSPPLLCSHAALGSHYPVSFSSCNEIFHNEEKLKILVNMCVHIQSLS